MAIESKQRQVKESAFRLAAEARVEKSEEIIKLLIDAVDEYAIFALDPHGNILTWNLGGQRLKGYSANEIIGRHFSVFYTPEDLKRNHPQAELTIAARDGKYEEEGWRLRKDGTKFWANIIITALRDQNGDLRGFGKVTRDLTQKRAMVLALKQSEERFRLMVENVQDYAIFMLDPRGYIATWNLGAERNKGYKASAIIGKHFSIFYDEESRKAQKPERELGEAVRVGRVEDEGWRVRQDGSRFWANVVITPVYDESKKLIGFTKVTRNLTERKQAEDNLRVAYASLESRVEERTRELSEAIAKAESAIKSRDQFFSIASHELKTPLFALKLQIQMRARKLKNGDASDLSSERMLEVYADDDRQVDRLTNLVDRMLDVSRMSSSDLHLTLEKTHLCEFLNSLAKRMKPILEGSSNELFVVCSQDVLGNWDQSRLDQVLTNLLTNAGRYAPGRPVIVKADALSDEVRIEVQDFGEGIAPEHQAKIFEPFERLKQAAQAQGLGLGLYICRRIVAAHGGQLSVRSILGQGTTFCISLPYNSDRKEISHEEENSNRGR